MKILSFESSAVSASVSLTEGTRLVAQSFQNCGLTHSRTLLPMAEALLSCCGVPLADVDAFAVAAGPGSFTGLRIGVATVKGLAYPTGKPCIGVSALEAMAAGLTGFTGDVCCVMDARGGQVYNALFRLAGTARTRLTEDRAVSLLDLGAQIGDTPQILVGDGADLCYTNLNETCSGLQLAPPHLRYPSAYGVALCALSQLADGHGTDANGLDVQYLRPPYVSQPKKSNIR